MTKVELELALAQAMMSQPPQLSLAEELAQQALNDFPNEPFGYQYLIELGQNRKYPPYQMLEDCRIKLYQLELEPLEQLFQLAALKWQQSDFDAALLIYQQILEKDPQYVAALLGAGQYFLQIKEEAQKSLHFFYLALEIELSYEAIRSTAQAHFALEEYQRVIFFLEKLPVREEVDAEVLRLLAESYEALSQFDQALEQWKALCLAFPEDGRYYQSAACLLIREKRYVAALQHSQQAMDLLGKDKLSDTFLEAAYRLYMTTGLPAKAIEVMQQLLLHFEGALVYELQLLQAERADNHARFPSHLAKLKQLDNPWIFNNCLLEEALYLLQQGKMAEAEAQLFGMLEQEGQGSLASYGLGILEQKRENWDAAFYYLYQAQEHEEERAAEQIAYYFGGYLKEKAQKIMAERAEEIKALLSLDDFAGVPRKAWQFSRLKEEPQEEGHPTEEQLERLKKQHIYFGPKAGIWRNEQGHYIRFAYALVAQQAPDVLDIQLYPLNGLTPLNCRLALREGELLCCIERQPIMVYREEESLKPELIDALSQIGSAN